jgi:hypothetical protein
MGNSFCNLGDRFDKARYEAGKTYGISLKKHIIKYKLI